MTAISVIIPTHDRSALLAEAIQSILAQTWRDFEVIVVDDGSTDDTSKVVRHIGDSRVRYLYAEHGERSVARNRGLEAAKGEYITFMDDDDLCLSHRLECQALFLNENDQAEMVSSGFYLQREGNPHRMALYRGDAPGGPGSLSWLCGQRPSIWACMFRRSVLKRMDHWFDPHLVPVEDVDFIWRLVLASGAHTTWLPEIIYVYRARRETILPKDLYEASCRWPTLLDKFFSRPDLPAEVKAHRTSAYIWHDVHNACAAYAVGQSRLAQFILLRGLALRPGLKRDGGNLIVGNLARLASLQGEDIGEYIRIANYLFDNLPSPLFSWERYRSRALGQVRDRGLSNDVKKHVG